VRIFRVKGQAGFTLIELIISLALTGIIAFTAFKFYASLNQQALSQQEISDIQQTNRACLEELSTALRSAGSGLTTSPAYAVSNDSLSVYMQAAGGVDTVLYFLQEIDDSVYTAMGIDGSSGMVVHWLMKQENSSAAQIYADCITDLRYTVINPRLVAITIEVQTTKADDTFKQNNGYRTFINTERVVVRNAD